MSPEIEYPHVGAVPVVDLRARLATLRAEEKVSIPLTRAQLTRLLEVLASIKGVTWARNLDLSLTVNVEVTFETAELLHSVAEANYLTGWVPLQSRLPNTRPSPRGSSISVGCSGRLKLERLAGHPT